MGLLLFMKLESHYRVRSRITDLTYFNMIPLDDGLRLSCWKVRVEAGKPVNPGKGWWLGSG